MTEPTLSEMPVAVQARGVGKSYRKHYNSAARLMDFANYVLTGRRSPRFFSISHVLSDIELTVHKGRSLGIIGQNGSGKSTLLKMVASIINPSSGVLEVNGRVASIIELGAGFNTEDTGLQNIYSYLTMYSIPSAEVAGKTEKIIEFSGLGEKINSPLKSYSSGMTVRLAFAIIAHLDADILLVDEALAVGDAVFSQKCIRFIQAFKERGTILFVSHDLNSLQAICDEVIWIHDGIIKARGAARPVCEAYLEFTLSADYPEQERERASAEIMPAKRKAILSELAPLSPAAKYEVGSEADLSRGFGGSQVQVLGVTLRSSTGEERSLLVGGEEVELAIRVKASVDVTAPIVGFLVKNSRGVEIFGENTLHDLQSGQLQFMAGSNYEAVFRFGMPVLPSGDYTVSVAVADGDFHLHQQLVWHHDVLVMRVASERFRYGLIGLSGTKVSVHQEETEVA